MASIEPSVDFGSRRNRWGGGRAQQSPEQGLCWGKGWGELAQPREAPQGISSPAGVFVIPGSIFQPPPGAVLVTTGQSHIPHVTAPGEGNVALGMGLALGTVSRAVPARCARTGVPPSVPRVPFAAGTSRGGCRARGALPAGVAAGLGVPGAVTALAHGLSRAALSLQRCLCPMGSLGGQGWVEEQRPEWEAGEPGGSCAFKSLFLFFLRSFPLPFKAFASASEGFPGQKCSSELCTKFSPSCWAPAQLCSILPPLHGLGAWPARAPALPKPAAPAAFGEGMGDFSTHTCSCLWEKGTGRSQRAQTSRNSSEKPSSLSVLHSRELAQLLPEVPKGQTALPSLPLHPSSRKQVQGFSDLFKSYSHNVKAIIIFFFFNSFLFLHPNPRVLNNAPQIPLGQTESCMQRSRAWLQTPPKHPSRVLEFVGIGDFEIV